MSPANQQPQQTDKPVEQQAVNKGAQVSQPDTDRPYGPFEHSGETARQTEAERQEEAGE